MGKLIVEKSESCQDCQGVFNDDLKYHAVNRCAKCYTKFKAPEKKKTRANGKSAYTHCLGCKFEFNTFNDKGKIVVYQSSGFCRRCYSRQYTNKNDRTCLKCQRALYNTTKMVCKICLELEKQEYYKQNPKAKKSRTFQQKLKALNKELTYDQFELIRRLLSRFKFNYYTYADFFRLVDIYVDIYDHEAHLDAYLEADQIEIMLRRLKDVWFYNKELRTQKEIIEKEKLAKKRKRLLKD